MTFIYRSKLYADCVFLNNYETLINSNPFIVATLKLANNIQKRLQAVGTESSCGSRYGPATAERKKKHKQNIKKRKEKKHLTLLQVLS